jgi:hypothetical protein
MVDLLSYTIVIFFSMYADFTSGRQQGQIPVKQFQAIGIDKTGLGVYYFGGVNVVTNITIKICPFFAVLLYYLRRNSKVGVKRR